MANGLIASYQAELAGLKVPAGELLDLIAAVNAKYPRGSHGAYNRVTPAAVVDITALCAAIDNAEIYTFGSAVFRTAFETAAAHIVERRVWRGSSDLTEPWTKVASCLSFLYRLATDVHDAPAHWMFFVEPRGSGATSSRNRCMRAFVDVCRSSGKPAMAFPILRDFIALRAE